MPMPIRPVGDENRNNKQAELSFDYSVLLSALPKTEQSNKKIVIASDGDASMLLELWACSQKTATDTFKLDKETKITSSDLIKLKSHGLITGGSEEVKLTGKGKAVITTMVLGESNNFLKDKKQKSYTEILASMNKRGKTGYRIPTMGTNAHLLDISNIGKQQE